MENLKKTIWGFAEIWNKSLERKEEYILKKRDNLWASELGKSPIDIWLKLRATPLTNPPNARSLRKFEAGNVFEWIVSLILKRAGILKESQRWSSFQYPNLLKVTGKTDFIAGGKVDMESFRNEIDRLELPDIFIRAGKNIVTYLEENYPNGLAEIPLEIKSVSSFMFEAFERKHIPMKNHRIQIYHYLISENRPIANLVYICRDDLRMMEFPITIESYVKDEYKESIEKISKYHLENERPPLEKEIIFDDDIGKFCKNFNVAYSGYLTMLYGYANQKEFDDTVSPTVSRWNRVLARIKNGKEMTTKNTMVLNEIELAGFKTEEIKEKYFDEEIEL